MNRMAVTFVTGNKNKLAEVQAILADVLPNLKSQALDRKYDQIEFRSVITDHSFISSARIPR